MKCDGTINHYLASQTVGDDQIVRLCEAHATEYGYRTENDRVEYYVGSAADNVLCDEADSSLLREQLRVVLAKEGRILDAGRIEQGFKTQEHLDAFYRYFDHTQSCVTCQQPGEGMLLDDGIQPTQQRCAEAQRLYALTEGQLYDSGTSR